MSWAIGARARRLLLGVLCAGLVVLGGAASAQGAAPDPDFVFLPGEGPEMNNPCGLTVNLTGGVGVVYVANYYAHRIDTVQFVQPKKLVPLALSPNPLDGPCAFGFDSAGTLYANSYHRNVVRYARIGGGYGPPMTIDSSFPTGVAVDPATDNVYVNARTYVAGYDSTGAPLLNGPDPLKIGGGSLGDGYGIAVSRFPLTAGRLYAPDHADDTVKVYDPLIDKDDPVQTIAGPPGGFGSLRDSAVAIDNVTGEVYVADTLAYPQYSERPEATIYVFGHNGGYKGRLKYNVIDGSPPGLAVDNTNRSTQSRVYVTSGNTVQGSIYAYPPDSATNIGAPAAFSLAVSASGSGGGSIVSSVGGIDCETACEEQIRSGAEVSLTASPEPGSAFAGWSGGGCSGAGECVVQMSEARSIGAEFEALSGPPAPTASASVIAQEGTLRVAVSGKLSPRRLPRKGTAPISVSVGGEITTTDETLPPQLKTLRIELNRNGRLDSTGLPICVYDRIQPGSSSRALSGCRSSLVGEGSFTASITLAGQEPYPTKGRLLVFNGLQDGKPVLFGHIYSPSPFATSFVIVFKLQKLGRGTYGTALNAPLPKAMDAWGRLTGLEMTLSRRYSFKGEPRSFISAGCPAPKGFPGATFPLARTEFSFDGGKKLSSVLSSECKAKG